MMARDGAWCGSCAGGLGWVMTWRRARMVLLSTQGMDVPAIAKVACAKSKPADHDLPFPVLKLVEAGGVPRRRPLRQQVCVGVTQLSVQWRIHDLRGPTGDLPS